MIIVGDIGGTRMRFAWCDAVLGMVGEPIIEPTPAKYSDGIRRCSEILQALKTAHPNEPFEGVVLGLPGIVNSVEGLFVSSPHLSGWAGQVIGDDLSALLNVPVFLCNDASLAALGEAHFGAGRGHDIVTYFTVSTGIGGARVVRGRLDARKYSTEPGFQIMDAGTGATLESLASGTAVEARYGAHPRDVAKTASWAQVERTVAQGLYNSILHWSPDCVVVGGSMSNDLSAARLKALVSGLMHVHPEVPEFALAELGAIGGLYGGIVLWRQKG